MGFGEEKGVRLEAGFGTKNSKRAGKGGGEGILVLWLLVRGGMRGVRCEMGLRVSAGV